MPDDRDRERDLVLSTLRAFRDAAPGTSGILLASDAGEPLAHDMGAFDATPLARAALVARHAAGVRNAGTFVDGPEGPVLVVFLPRGALRVTAPPASGILFPAALTAPL